MSKKIWARIGITLEVSDDYYEELKDRADKNGTCDLSESEAKIWITEGTVNGDSYIPGEVWYDWLWDNNLDIPDIVSEQITKERR